MHHFNLDQDRPQFAGDPEPLVFSIISDAVKHIGAMHNAGLFLQSGQFDPTHDPAIGRRNAGDEACLPDVSIDFALHQFQLVEEKHGPAAMADFYPPDFMEGLGIQETQSFGSVADIRRDNVGQMYGRIRSGARGLGDDGKDIKRYLDPQQLIDEAKDRDLDGVLIA